MVDLFCFTVFSPFPNSSCCDARVDFWLKEMNNLDNKRKLLFSGDFKILVLGFLIYENLITVINWLNVL